MASNRRNPIIVTHLPPELGKKRLLLDGNHLRTTRHRSIITDFAPLHAKSNSVLPLHCSQSHLRCTQDDISQSFRRKFPQNSFCPSLSSGFCLSPSSTSLRSSILIICKCKLQLIIKEKWFNGVGEFIKRLLRTFSVD